MMYVYGANDLRRVGFYGMGVAADLGEINWTNRTEESPCQIPKLQYSLPQRHDIRYE